MAEEEFKKVKKRGVGKKIAIVIVILLIIFGGYLAFKKTRSGSVTSVVDSSKYQAVFLSNGQAYFGKVADPNATYVSLSDVYYLVLNQPLQSQNNTNQNNNNQQGQNQSPPAYTLVKLGNEMHGPTSMSINKDQILFIENLSDDSKVVTAIKNQK